MPFYSGSSSSSSSSSTMWWISCCCCLLTTTAIVVAAAASRSNKPSDNNNNRQRRINDDPIYLDYAATTPVDPAVLKAMLPYWTEHCGNPSSSHWAGQAPAAALLVARRQIWELLFAPSNNSNNNNNNNTTTTTNPAPTFDPESILFTSCGTEANNWAIAWALELWRRRRYVHDNNCTTTTTATTSNTVDTEDGTILPHIVTSNVEHPAIFRYLQHLQERNLCTVTYVPVGTDGRVTLEAMIHAMDQHRDRLALVTLQYANNEVGAVQPVPAVAAYCRQLQLRVCCHTDAAQAVGKIDVSSSLQDVDFVTVVGHKIGAPKGVACLYASRAVRQGPPVPFLHGGGQESGWRGGTENVAYAVGLGQAACAYAPHNKNGPRRRQHMEQCRQYLLEQLQHAMSTMRLDNGDTTKNNNNVDMRVHGPTDPAHRLPNILSVGLRGVSAPAVLARLQSQVALSAGAACHSGEDAVSAVLQAMAIPVAYGRGTLRWSVAHTTTLDEIDRAVELLVQALREEQREQGDNHKDNKCR